MIRNYLFRRLVPLLGFILAVVALVFAARAVRAGQGASQGQPQGQAGQSQGQGQSQEKQKKKGGFFGAMKAVSGSSSEQTSATASAGARGVDNEDGQKIADTTPTAADQQAVAAMDSYSLPQGALSKFIEGGRLKPKQ